MKQWQSNFMMYSKYRINFNGSVSEAREKEIGLLKECLEQSRHQLMITERKLVKARNTPALNKDESDRIKQAQHSPQDLTESHELEIKLSWRRGKPAPQTMKRWCNAIADETMT